MESIININSSYSSELTTSNEEYIGQNKYYQSIQIMVNTSGNYIFTSIENIDDVGYLYQSNFDPSNPMNNLIVEDDQSDGNNQFSFSVDLQAGVPYTLVFTTYSQRVTGPFTIVASGPDNVNFTPINVLETTMIMS